MFRRRVSAQAGDGWTGLGANEFLAMKNGASAQRGLCRESFNGGSEMRGHRGPDGGCKYPCHRTLNGYPSGYNYAARGQGRRRLRRPARSANGEPTL